MASSRYSAQRGRDGELAVMALLSEEGWMVASRRHVPGPGDVLAIKPMAMAQLRDGQRRPIHEVWLVEVKTTAQSPYERFGPADRTAMRKAAHDAGAEALLAWRPPTTREWTFIPAVLWPKNDADPRARDRGSE